MVQYILECIAFQLLFLVVYDLFLKKETFFQKNRVYLIGSYVLSIILPGIKIAAFRTSLPDNFIAYPEYLWNMKANGVVVLETANSGLFSISWEYGVLLGGMFLALLLFAYKLYQIRRLKVKGEVFYFKTFTQVLIQKSSVAFSFFKTVFLGDQIKEKDYENILKHELVHIKQRHSYDLLFFEVMRIVCWFNPMVYLYQKRVAELHEFIADAEVAKTNKKEQYQLLLSQVFQTENISFINQFFTSSLIKKRIVMLQKQKSKKSYQLKYLLLVPLVVGMLFYTSLAKGEGDTTVASNNPEDIGLIAKINREIDEELEKVGSIEEVSKNLATKINSEGEAYIFSKNEYFKFRIVINRMSKNHKVRFGDDVKTDYNPKKQTLPSTEEYEFYVNRGKAFQILDKNLDISVPRKTHDAILVKKSTSYAKDCYVYKVSDIKDLSGLETLTFNTKMKEVFTQESPYKNLIIEDTKNAVRVFRKVIIVQQEYTEDVPFAMVDNVPVFPGCENETDKRTCFQEKMQEHIRKHFSYPLEAQELGIQGRVSVLFRISKNGKIVGLRMRGPHELLEDEAKRIISKLPKMKPGVHKGKNVNVPFSIPITFKLNSKKLADLVEVKEDEDGNSFKFKMEDSPLILVDGVDTSKEEMEKIDADAIESINVYKDKMAIDKYGEKGKNGVILITLKK